MIGFVGLMVAAKYLIELFAVAFCLLFGVNRFGLLGIKS